MITTYKPQRPLADLRRTAWAPDEKFNQRQMWARMELRVSREWGEATYERQQCYVEANRAIKAWDAAAVKLWTDRGAAWMMWERGCARTLHQLWWALLTGKMLTYHYY